jgi:histidine triad (HIT) family protein
MKITGSSAYNVLENNGALAHQAVHHVHFHVIPKPDEGSGLGVRWPSGKLGPDAAELARQIAAAL